MAIRAAVVSTLLLVYCVRAVAYGDAMFRGDAAHTGLYDSAAPSLRTVKWRAHTSGELISSPVVADGLVYIGSTDGRVYAFHVADGSTAWTFRTKGPVNASPAVAHGLVYFSSVDGTIYAVNAADGRERWSFQTQGERRFEAPGIHGLTPAAQIMADPFDIFLSSPVVADGAVFVGSGDRHVYALDAATGALRWAYATGNVVHATPAVSGGTVYIGSWDRNLYALDAHTGTLKWTFQTGDDRTIYNQVGISSSAAVANGTVYFGCRDSHFYAVDAHTGKLRWSHDEKGSWVVGSPTVGNGIVTYTTSDGLTYRALDASSGAERFSLPYETFSFSSPSVAGSTAYFGTSDGSLYAVDLVSGKIIAIFHTDAARNQRASHIGKDGKIDMRTFFHNGTYEEAIIGLDRYFAFGGIFGSPAIASGVLYVGSADGTLYAID